MYKRRLEQVHVCLSALGISITDPRRFAFSLMNTILGGNMSSRLFQEIRERRGMAYSVYSFMMSHMDTGLFGVYTGVAPENVKPAVDLIVEALQRLRRDPVSVTEINDAKEYTKGNLFLAAESVDNQMVRLAQNEIHFGRHIQLDDVIKNIEAVTPDQIQELAQALFAVEQSSLTVLGPVKKKEASGLGLIEG
jgi:predicted Zn-dependent peptidase